MFLTLNYLLSVFALGFTYESWNKTTTADDRTIVRAM